MEQNLDKKKELKDKVLHFFKENKFKLYLLSAIILIATISIFFIKISNEKNNVLISEKYVRAGLYFTSQQKEESRKIYEEIIYSENKFYSALSLNSILEKDLELDKKKILNYFDIIENLNISKEQKDLVLLKKALYLIKSSNSKEGNQILKSLIASDSKLKSLAEEILTK